MDYVHLAYIILFAVCTVAVRLKLRFTGLLLQLYKYCSWFNKLWFNRLFLHKCEKRKTKLVIKFKMLFHDKYLAIFINLTTAKIMKKRHYYLNLRGRPTLNKKIGKMKIVKTVTPNKNVLKRVIFF